MKKNTTIPTEVTDWVNSHKGSRVPLHCAGQFQSWANSKTCSCWGQPAGGTVVGNYKVAVCQPSPRKKGDIAPFWFDFEPIVAK